MKRIVSVVLGMAFMFVGVLHFVRPAGFVAIMPTWIPFHLFWGGVLSHPAMDEQRTSPL